MQQVVKQNKYGQDRTSRDFDSSTNKWVNTTEHVENGSVVIDNATGKVLAFSGGVDFKILKLTMPLILTALLVLQLSHI